MGLITFFSFEIFEILNWNSYSQFSKSQLLIPIVYLLDFRELSGVIKNNADNIIFS